MEERIEEITLQCLTPRALFIDDTIKYRDFTGGLEKILSVWLGVVEDILSDEATATNFYGVARAITADVGQVYAALIGIGKAGESGGDVIVHTALEVSAHTLARASYYIGEEGNTPSTGGLGLLGGLIAEILEGSENPGNGSSNYQVPEHEKEATAHA